MESGHKIHLFYGILFTVIATAALIALAIIGSRADDATSTATIDNTAPTVDTVITTSSSGGSDSGDADSTGLVISESPSTTTVYVRGQVTDLNGCEQISTGNGDWQLKMYRTGASGAGSGATCTTADNNDCYNFTESAVTLSNCTAGGSDTTVDYQFAATLQSWIDPTDSGGYADTWTSKVTVTDSGSSTVSGTDLLEIGSTIGLDATSVNYGSLALGATSSNNTLTVTSVGNRALDLDISGTNMSCTGTGSTSIPVGNTHYALTDETYAASTAMTTSAANVDISIAAQTSETTATTGTLNLKLAVPSSGVSGTCSNTITLTAKANS